MPPDVIQLSACRVDLAGAVVVRDDGTQHPLTPIEAALVAYLQAHPGVAIPRAELLREVWGYAEGVQSRAVDHTMARLRRKVERVPGEPDHLQSVRGIGYRYDPPRPPPDAPRGRADDLDRLLAALDGDARLITVHGPPGVGKTTLVEALVARRPAPVARLDTASDTRGFLAAVADALDVPLGGDAAGQLAHALRAGPGLLVLDNAETVLAATAALTTAWLDQVPRLRIVATSTVRIATPAERVFALGPLSPDAATDVLTARARERGAALSDADRPAMARLAAALDHLPLALELAAPRLRVIGPDALRDRLDQRSRVLAGGTDGPARHRSLDAALAFTLDRLPDEARATLTACTVFVGAFDVEAAERIADRWVLDDLQVLVDHSLLRAVDGAFGLLHAVRDRVRRLSPPTDAVRDRHAAWCRDRWTALRPALDRDGGASALARLAELRGDLERAHAHAVRTGDAAAAGQLAAAWVSAALRVGPVIGVRAALDATVALPGADAGPWLLRGQVRAALGDPRGGLADLDHALTLADEPALRVARASLRLAVGDLAGAADDAARLLDGPEHAAAQRVNGLAADMRGDRPAARVALRDALDAYGARGDAAGRAWVRGDLARIDLEDGALDSAIAGYSEALALRRALGDRRHTAVLRANLAVGLHELGRLDDARAAWSEALDAHRRMGNARFAAWCRVGVATVDLERGDRTARLAALAVFRAEAATLLALGDRRFAAYTRARIGLALALTGQAGGAAAFAEARADLPASDHPALDAWAGHPSSATGSFARLGRRLRSAAP